MLHRKENGDDALARFLASSLGSFWAETTTLPADVAKVRLQVQRVGADGTLRYQGMYDCFRKTAAREGVSSLFKGLSPALVRQISYSSLSLVMYEPIRNVLESPVEAEKQHLSFWKRLLAGGLAGAISIAIVNPTDVLKTRMQTSTTPMPMLSVMKSIYETKGVVGLWSGVRPNMLRTFIVQASELGVYDQVKTDVAPYTGGDTFWAHLAGSTVAGLVSAITSTPVDVVKTRLMNDGARGSCGYRGMGHAFTSILEHEGARALYKGFLPIVIRKVAWVTVFFMTYENSRPLLKV